MQFNSRAFVMGGKVMCADCQWCAYAIEHQNFSNDAAVIIMGTVVCVCANFEGGEWCVHVSHSGRRGRGMNITGCHHQPLLHSWMETGAYVPINTTQRGWGFDTCNSTATQPVMARR